MSDTELDNITPTPPLVTPSAHEPLIKALQDVVFSLNAVARGHDAIAKGLDEVIDRISDEVVVAIRKCGSRPLSDEAHQSVGNTMHRLHDVLDQAKKT